MSVKEETITTVWINATKMLGLRRDKTYRITRKYPDNNPLHYYASDHVLEWAHGVQDRMISYGVVRDRMTERKALIHRQQDLNLYLRVAPQPTSDSGPEISTVAPSITIQVEEL